MRLFQAIAEALALPTMRKAKVALQYETANLSSNATVSSIQSALRSAEGGETRELFGLYRDLTAGGSHIQAELNKRKLAVLAQPMSVLPADKGKREDMEAAAAVTQMIAGCENWMDGLTHLLDSCLWPVAVVEKIFAPSAEGQVASGAPRLRYGLRRLEVVNPAVLCFRRPYGAQWEPRNTRNTQNEEPAKAGAPGEEWESDLRFYSTDAEGRINWSYDATYGAERSRHIIHRGHLLVGLRDCWGGPMRAVVFWWLLGTLGRDWFARGMERWGMPVPVGHTDAKDPQAVELLQSAFSLSTKIGGLVVDHDTQIELKEIAAAGLADAHERFLNVCNREISKLIVGQELSSTAQPTGLGSGVANLQSDVREDIRMFDQIKLGETLRQQLFEPFLRINGLRGAAPKPVWGGLSDEDAKTLAELLDILARAGWEPTDEAVPTISERLGFPVQRKAPAGLGQDGQDRGGEGFTQRRKDAKGSGWGKGEMAQSARRWEMGAAAGGRGR